MSVAYGKLTVLVVYEISARLKEATGSWLWGTEFSKPLTTEYP